MRLIVEEGHGWWLPKTVVLWYPISLLLPFTIEFVAQFGHPAEACVLFGILLYMHEFLVARRIEYVRPYSSTSAGKHLAHLEEVAANLATGCYRLLKYGLVFGVLPIALWRSASAPLLWDFVTVACVLVLVSDVCRIASILRQMLFKVRRRPYLNIFAALVASYVSFILGFTMLFTALTLRWDGLFEGLEAPLVSIDFLYFNTVTFTTLGYGDVVPVAWPVRLVVAAENIVSFLLFAFTIAAVANHLQTSETK